MRVGKSEQSGLPGKAYGIVKPAYARVRVKEEKSGDSKKSVGLFQNVYPSTTSDIFRIFLHFFSCVLSFSCGDEAGLWPNQIFCLTKL
jgi:hypothetical protein